MSGLGDAPKTRGETMSERVARLTPAQKAAAVIAVLGEKNAPAITDKLDDTALEKITDALESIHFLTREELAGIVIEFLNHLRRSEGGLRGGASAKDRVANLISPERANDMFADPEPFLSLEDIMGSAPVEAVDTWSAVGQQKPEEVGEYLSRLSPNLIAIILQKLNVSIASNVCNFVDDEKLKLAMGYLVNAEVLDPEIETVIEQMVQIEFLNQLQDESGPDSEQLESIGELLSLLSDRKRNLMLDFLKGEHESRLESIQQSIFTIDGLPDLLPRSAPPLIFKEMDEAEIISLLSTLTGAFAPVQEFLLANISSRMADGFRETLEDTPAPDEAKAEEVQRAFLMRLMDMKRTGLINLDDIV